MITKLLILLTLAVSCGPQVKLKENQLENPSLLTSTKAHEMSGTISKGAKNIVQYQGKSYEVSKYSSKMALDYIAGMTAGAQASITFTGGFKGAEVVIENIR